MSNQKSVASQTYAFDLVCKAWQVLLTALNQSTHLFTRCPHKPHKRTLQQSSHLQDPGDSGPPTIISKVSASSNFASYLTEAHRKKCVTAQTQYVYNHPEPFPDLLAHEVSVS